MDCSSTLDGLSGLLRVNCFGTVGIASVECNYDNGAIVEACEQVQLLYNERLLYVGWILLAKVIAIPLHIIVTYFALQWSPA